MPASSFIERQQERRAIADELVKTLADAPEQERRVGTAAIDMLVDFFDNIDLLVEGMAVASREMERLGLAIRSNTAQMQAAGS